MLNLNSNTTLRFLLADDHTIVRQGIELLIEDLVEDFESEHASSLQQILQKIHQSNFDFAILDAQLQDGNCLSILSEIRKAQPELKILMFTSFEEENYSIKFIQAGANGFLSKLSEENEIRNALSELIEKGHFYPPFTQKLMALSADQADVMNPLNRLSERELQIASFYAQGYGNLEIANVLDVKQNTVSTFKKRIFEKLQIDNMVELIELMKIHHLPK